MTPLIYWYLGIYYLSIDTLNILVSQNTFSLYWYLQYFGISECIHFLLIPSIYWYLRIYSLYIDTLNILVSQNIFSLYWYLWYIGIAEEIRFSTWTSSRRWKGNGTTKKVTFIFTTSTILMSQRNLSDLSICFQIFWGGFLMIFSHYIRYICNRILCFVPRWIGWLTFQLHFKMLPKPNQFGRPN